MDLSNLGQSCAELLDQYVEELTALGIAVPDVRYISAGEVAWDCPSLTLYLGIGNSGEPGFADTRSFRVAREAHVSATFFVQILRMVSNIGPMGPWENFPAPTALQEDGETALKDAGGLLKSSILIFKSYKATGSGQSFAIGPVQSLGPNGGMAATRIRIDLSLG